MNKYLRADANRIIEYAINNSLPFNATKDALKTYANDKGRTFIIAIGKAAYTMGLAASETVNYDRGLIVTKYGHSKGAIDRFEIIEAGHPIPDENSILGASKAISMVSDLDEKDTVIFLVSGGGSALFEKPLIPFDKLQNINTELIKSGATINEINTIRKRLSMVKGGKFALMCKPAKVISIILSDIINDPLDMIASGPAYPDASTYKDAVNIIYKYHIDLDPDILSREDVKKLDNVETHIILNNAHYLKMAALKAKELGYDVIEVNKPLTCDVKDAVSLMSSYIKDYKCNSAVIFGGEITVNAKGEGLGGRNQHLSLALSKHLKKGCGVFCVGSDGTDGPTDAAGGYFDYSMTLDNIDDYLNNSDSYHGLEKVDGLIKTGPTGTNVCDMYILLYQKEKTSA